MSNPFFKNYSSVDENDIIVFSYIGMQTVEKSVKGVSTINVVLEEDSNVLNEVAPRSLRYFSQ